MRKRLGKSLQLHAFLVHLHNALQRRLIGGGHLARQVEDVDVLRDRYFTPPQDRQQWRLSYTHEHNNYYNIQVSSVSFLF